MKGEDWLNTNMKLLFEYDERPKISALASCTRLVAWESEVRMARQVFAKVNELLALVGGNIAITERRVSSWSIAPFLLAGSPKLDLHEDWTIYYLDLGVAGMWKTLSDVDWIRL